MRQRGSLTVWFTDEAIEGWQAKPRTTPGGQPWHSFLAILTALTLQAVFQLALWQTKGLIGSVIGLLALTLAVPDHTTICHWAEMLETPRLWRHCDADPLPLLVDNTGLKLCNTGEWLVEKHGAITRRSWRKPHIGLDAETGWIVAAVLTTKEVDAGAEVSPLLNQVSGPVVSFTADASCVQDGVSTAVTKHHPVAAIIVSSRSTVVPSGTTETAPTQRDRHLQGVETEGLPEIAEHGRAAWQKASGYTNQTRAEAAISRFEQVISNGLRSRTDQRRAAKANMAVHALNRVLEPGRPTSVCIA